MQAWPARSATLRHLPIPGRGLRDYTPGNDTGADPGAAYFGRNEVRYYDFDFRILESEHLDVYHYEAERGTVDAAARMAERWYFRLSEFFDHDLAGRQPFILYAAHPHFRQTTAITGEIGQATGGVTEPLKRRVVLPVAGDLVGSDHVIGHELVHAFQYDMSGIDPTSARCGRRCREPAGRGPEATAIAVGGGVARSSGCRREGDPATLMMPTVVRKPRVGGDDLLQHME